MKSEISRHSYRAAKRFSGVYLQQGRMITDADWNEMVDVQRALIRNVGDDAIGSGVPRDGGLVVVDSTASNGQLQWGDVYVDGIHAILAPRVAGKPFEYGFQADFLAADDLALVDGRALYVDVWERTITSTHDGDLVDPAWNGADTTTRKKVMAQLKQCAMVADQPAMSDPALNPQLGSAVVSAKLRGSEADPDPCDPCDDRVDPDLDIGNYLFRVEVHNVTYAHDGSPEEITLKWSSENGSETYPHGPPLPRTFEDNTQNHHFEFFSTKTEQNLGISLDATVDAAAGVIQASVEPTPNGDWTGVRRWDGWLRLKGGQGWSGIDGFERARDLVSGAAETLTVSGDTITMPLDRLELSVAIDTDTAVVRGDYWLIEVRGDRGPDRAVRVVEPSGHPIGPVHHYLFLGVWDEQNGVLTFPEDESDSVRRQLSFPRLNDLPAEAVSYVGDCDSGLYEGVKTVDDALDAICDIDASHIGLTSDCAVIQPAANVAEALDLLCEEVEKKIPDCSPRLALFGRGVVCGLVPNAKVADPIFIREFREFATFASTDHTDAAPEPTTPVLSTVADFAASRFVEGDVRTLTRDELVDLVTDARSFVDDPDDNRPLVTFTTSAGTIIDGLGCLHKVGPLEVSERFSAYKYGWDGDVLSAISLHYHLATNRPDLESPLYDSKDEAMKDLKKRLLGDEPDHLLKQLVEENVVLRPIEAKKALHFVPGTGDDGHHLELRLLVPGEYEPMPKLEIPFEPVDFVGEAVDFARFASEASGHTFRPHEIEHLIVDGAIGLGAMNELIGERTGTGEPPETNITLDSVTRDADASAPMRVNLRSVWLAPDPPTLDQQQAAAWQDYTSIKCPEANDGSVYLATVGSWGDNVFVSPEGREQIFTTPANQNAKYELAQGSLNTFQAMMEAAKA